MIDLSNLKSPGWAKVVAELNAGAPDDKSFLERLLAVITQVSAARQGVLYIVERGEGDEAEPRPAAVWPPVATPDGQAHAPGDGHIAGAVEMAAEAKNAARAAAGSGNARAYGLDKQSQYYDGRPGQGFLLAVPVAPHGSGGQQGGGGAQTGMAGAGSVITLLIEPRSNDAVRSTLAMAEVLAGYVYGHGARQALKRTQQASFALDLATRLIASVNTSPNFKGAAMQLANDLAKQFGVDRVALGWIKNRDGEEIKVEAISDTEHFDRRMAMVQKLQHAMDECLDQEQPVLYPPPPAEGPRGDVLLAQAITHAHRELAAGDAKLKVCSLPLRIEEQVVGVVTIESTGDGAIELATVELMQSALDLIAPVLRIRRSDDRIVAARAWESTLKGGSWLVGPKHTAWKLVGVLALAGMAFVSLYTTTYRVGADAVLEPREKRTVSSPLEGVIASLGEDAGGDTLEPGDAVKAGQLLVKLDDTEWKLSAIDAQQKIAQAELEAAAAAAEGDRGKVEKALQQKKRAEAELDIYKYRLQKAEIRSPIDGTILGGRLQERVGSAVKLGDALMEVAPLNDMVAVIRVDERDIALVTRAFDEGEGSSAGELATKGRPSDPVGLTVERIVPLSESRDGKNTYEVRAKLSRVEPWMRPGMEGRARLDTQRHSLLWIGTRRIVDTVRLWLW